MLSHILIFGDLALGMRAMESGQGQGPRPEWMETYHSPAATGARIGAPASGWSSEACVTLAVARAGCVACRRRRGLQEEAMRSRWPGRLKPSLALQPAAWSSSPFSPRRPAGRQLPELSNREGTLDPEPGWVLSPALRWLSSARGPEPRSLAPVPHLYDTGAAGQF